METMPFSQCPDDIDVIETLMADARAAKVPSNQIALTGLTERKVRRLLMAALQAGVTQEHRRNEAIEAARTAKKIATRSDKLNKLIRKLLPDVAIAVLVVVGLAIVLGVSSDRQSDLLIGFSLLASALIYWRHRRTL